MPHLLDPVNLDTIERYDFFGALKTADPCLSACFFPSCRFPPTQEDPNTGELWNFGLYLGPHPKILLYNIRGGVALTVTREIPLPAPLLAP